MQLYAVFRSASRKTDRVSAIAGAGPIPIRSVMSSMPMGRPSRSTTGNSLNLSRLQEVDGVADSGFRADHVRVPGHHHFNRCIQGGIAARFEQAGQVAVGEEPSEAASGIDEHDRAGAPAGVAYVREDSPHGVGRCREAQFLAASHTLRHRRELAAEAARRVVPCEIVRRELALLEEDKCQGIAEGDHHGRAGARRERERAGLYDRAIDDCGIRGATEGACRIAGDNADSGRELAERPEQADKFVRLAAVREKERNVVRMDCAEIAVDGAGGVERVGAGTGGVERADNLLPDVGRLAHSGHGDPAATVEQHPGHAIKAIAQTVGHFRERPSLDFEDVAGEREPVKRRGGHWHVPVPVGDRESGSQRYRHALKKASRSSGMPEKRRSLTMRAGLRRPAGHGPPVAQGWRAGSGRLDEKWSAMRSPRSTPRTSAAFTSNSRHTSATAARNASVTLPRRTWAKPSRMVTTNSDDGRATSHANVIATPARRRR